MKTIVSMVTVLVVVLVGSVAFGQSSPTDASASGTAVMCGALEVPVGCVCADAASNTLNCAAGAEVAVPVGKAGGKLIVENGGKTTISVPPIQAPPTVQPETKDSSWSWLEYGLAGAVAVGLGAGTYYVVDSMTTTTVHVRDK